LGFPEEIPKFQSPSAITIYVFQILPWSIESLFDNYLYQKVFSAKRIVFSHFHLESEKEKRNPKDPVNPV